MKLLTFFFAAGLILLLTSCATRHQPLVKSNERYKIIVNPNRGSVLEVVNVDVIILDDEAGMYSISYDNSEIISYLKLAQENSSFSILSGENTYTLAPKKKILIEMSRESPRPSQPGVSFSVPAVILGYLDLYVSYAGIEEKVEWRHDKRSVSIINFDDLETVIEETD